MNIRTDIREYEYEYEYSSHTGDLSPIWQLCLVASKGVLQQCAWRRLSLVSTGLDDKVTAVLVILPIKVTAIVVGWPSKVKAIVVSSFLLLQQSAVQSSILFLSHIVDRVLQTCFVVKKSTPQTAAFYAIIAISYIFRLRLAVIATRDKCQGPAYLLVPFPV